MTHPHQRRRNWTKITGIVLLFVFFGIAWGCPRWRKYLDSVAKSDVKAGPMIARDASGKAVVATLLVRDVINWKRPSRRGRATDQLVEVQLNQADDLTDLGKVSVQRSESQGNLNLYLLGAESDRVWIFADGLYGVKLSNRSLELTPETIEQKLPDLRGQLSKEKKYYQWDREKGFTITTRDGRKLDLHTSSWTTSPATEPPPQKAATSQEEYRRQMADYNVKVAESLAATLGSRPGEYGLDSTLNKDGWFGLLSDSEKQKLTGSWQGPRQQRLDPIRRKLWTANPTPPNPSEYDEINLGTLQPARSGKEYIRGGFLRDGSRLRPVTIAGSSDLFIEHYTAIDDTAQMQLTRIAPDGNQRWTTTIPTKFPRSVDVAGNHVIFTGLPPGTDLRLKLQLISVNLADGSFRTFSYNR